MARWRVSTMALLRLSMACGPYDRMEALRSGEVRPEGIDLTCLAIQSPPEIFARMIKTGSFDVSEMSSAHYLIMKARGDFPFLAIPVFPSRAFRHGFIFVNTGSGITAPGDLAGKRIGVQEYRQSAAVWIRGMLGEEYGVDLAGATWFEGGVDAPRRIDPDMDLRPGGTADIRVIASDRSLGGLLARGEIDALIGARRPRALGESAQVARLFPDYRAVERDYFARTGIFPIMHTLVIREDVHAANPWIAESLYQACVKSKTLAHERMRFSGAMRYMLPWLFDDIDEIDAVFGGDPFVYGLEPNRTTLETLLRYLREDAFIGDAPRLEDLFAPIIDWQE